MMQSQSPDQAPTLRRVPDAYHAAAGMAADGWYAGVLLLRDCDAGLVEPDPESTDRKRRLLPGVTFEQWASACVDAPAAVALVCEGAGEPEVLARGLHVYPPAAAREATASPVIAWAESQDGGFALRLHRQGRTRTVASGDVIPAHVSVCVLDGRVYLAACVCEAASDPRVRVWDSDGVLLADLPGRSPVLRAGDGSLLLLREWSDRAGTQLELTVLETDGNVRRRTAVGDPNEMNTHPDLLVNGRAGHLVWETSPAWGSDFYPGAHRRLALLGFDTDAPDPLGPPQILPTPAEAFLTAKDRRVCPPMNLPPLFPRLVDLGDGRAAVAYRRFRPDRKRAFGWDVWLMTPTGAGWSPAHRVSTSYGSPDAGYDVLRRGEQFVGLFPSCTNPGLSTMLRDVRTEVETFPLDRDLGEWPIEDRVDGVYVVPPAQRDPAPPPPVLPDAPADLQLLWGDLHRHSFQSKCFCVRDGSPEEVLRYCRDVLECDVLVLTDHHHHMGSPESTWLSLQTEQESAGRVLLYGTEPGTVPGHHTNLYASDRRTWERGRCISLLYHQRDEMYDAIRRYLPEGALVPVRHVHGTSKGQANIYSEETVRTLRPDLEFAMEALQCRGHYLLDGDFEAAHRYPTNFLNAGARLALLGGTDHTGQPVANRFGLTGLWTRERSVEGVWEAIRARRTVAVANGKIALWATCAGKPMGAEIAACGEDVAFDVTVSAARPLRRVGLMQDGEVALWQDVSGALWQGELRPPAAPAEGNHWYVILVQGESTYTEGADTDLDDPRAPWCRAFSSPFYLRVAATE